jgi:transketolase
MVGANGLTQHGRVGSIMGLEPLAANFESFGWHVQELANGHDQAKVAAALTFARSVERPTVIIARTVKGHDVSFMENDPLWHLKEINDDEYKRAVDEIDARRATHV